MVNKLVKPISKWITAFNWTEKRENELSAEIDKLEDTKINVSLRRNDSGWGDVETLVPLVKCFDSVVDELVYNKRGRKLFLLMLIELFKDNPSILKEIK